MRKKDRSVVVFTVFFRYTLNESIDLRSSCRFSVTPNSTSALAQSCTYEGKVAACKAHFRIILYNHLHMQRELEAIPALFMRIFLKDVVDDSENREWLAFGKPRDQENFLSTLEEAFSR